MFGAVGLAAGRWFEAGGLPGRFAGWVEAGGLPGRYGWPPGRATVGVAGLPGGACFTIGRAAGALAGRKLCICCRAMGCPGCAASACCRAANGTGEGGGATFATTARLATAAGGATARPAVLACAPSTLLEVGATAALELTGMEATCFAFTATAARATGCALTKACCGTAVTAPATLRFAYVTLVMFVLLLTMVVL